MDITYTNTITVKQYNELRRAVGWFEIQEEYAEKGLSNTAFLIVATVNSMPVGMTRVVTDYSYVVLIADVVVHPDYQGSGIGKTLVVKALEHIKQNISPGQGKNIHLMAAKGREGFYKKLGFQERPNDKYGSGMTQWAAPAAGSDHKK